MTTNETRIEKLKRRLKRNQRELIVIGTSTAITLISVAYAKNARGKQMQDFAIYVPKDGELPTVAHFHLRNGHTFQVDLMEIDTPNFLL